MIRWLKWFWNGGITEEVLAFEKRTAAFEEYVERRLKELSEENANLVRQISEVQRAQAAVETVRQAIERQPQRIKTRTMAEFRRVVGDE